MQDAKMMEHLMVNWKKSVIIANIDDKSKGSLTDLALLLAK